tara:strand:+ start:3368 stop:3541 length:174 start_codon:yes stop_codon:yes gene_type:complete
MAIRELIINIGLIALSRETPADFMATSSYRSARLPNTMILDNNMAKGNAIGIRCMAK